jgi:hypothetical protein
MVAVAGVGLVSPAAKPASEPGVTVTVHVVNGESAAQVLWIVVPVGSDVVFVVTLTAVCEPVLAPVRHTPIAPTATEYVAS